MKRLVNIKRYMDLNNIVNIATKMLLFIALVLVMVVHQFLVEIKTPIYIYLSTVFSIFYIFISIPFIIRNYKKITLKKIDKFLIYFISLYIVCSLLQYTFFNHYYFYYVLIKCIVLLTFVCIVINIKINESFNEIRIFVSRIFIALMVFIGLCAILRINVSYSAKTIIEITNVKEDFLMWFTHKSRLATFTVLSIGFIWSYKFSKIYIKYIVLFLNLICIYRSDSTTALVLSIFLIISIIIIDNVKYVKSIITKKMLIIIIMSGVIIIYLAFQYVNSVRNIATMGDRTNIWKAVWPYIQRFPGGIGNSDNFSFIARADLTVRSAHNIFIQEFLENGYVIGCLFLMVIILILISVYKQNKISFVSLISVLLLANMDMTVALEVYNIFFYVIAVIYCDVSSDKKNELRSMK